MRLIRLLLIFNILFAVSTGILADSITDAKFKTDNFLLAQIFQQPAAPPNTPSPLWHHSKEKQKTNKISDANNLLKLVKKVLHHISSNHYQLGGNIFDLNRGIYHLDCSEYVDNLVKRIDPTAYQTISKNGSIKPTSLDYFAFLSAIHSGQTRYHWYRVPNLSAVKAGDILVFRYKDLANKKSGGHMMVILAPPKKFIWSHDAYSLRISDSAPAGHTTDTRQAHTSGIGVGSLLLKIDPKSDLPIAYAWKWFAPWHTDMYYIIARLQN
jgi:hypothetical protein